MARIFFCRGTVLRLFFVMRGGSALMRRCITEAAESGGFAFKAHSDPGLFG